MTNTIIECMSTRKLTYVLIVLLSMQVVCFLIGALISPMPNSSMQYLATNCIDLSGGKNRKDGTEGWFAPRGPSACKRIDSFSSDEASKLGLTADNVVFAFQMPHPRDNTEIDFSRWQQNLIAVMSMDIMFENGVEHDSRVHLLIDARLGYRNKGDPAGEWKEYASSFANRNLDCEIDEDKKREGYFYNCSTITLFELGSLHHDYYLLNLRLPSIFDYDGHEININENLGKLVDVWVTAIHQNGGFTKVWLSLKSIFFPIVVVEIIWFWRRINQLPRDPTLLEKMLMALGCSLTFLNLPMEYFTLAFDLPWMNLFNDVKQGIFYATLMVFWLVFTGEHMINEDGATGERNGILAYWKKLAVALFGCLCLFVFDMCEKGVQLRNPFFSIWTTDLGTNLALGFIILGGLSAGVFFLFMCYYIYKVQRTLSARQLTISSMSRVRRLHYEGLIWRFQFLMLATLITCAMTAIGFILGQVAEGQYKWDENISLEYMSGFMTGVYGMWNIYIMALVFLYAPSHKNWSSSSEATDATPGTARPDGTRTGEEIEFSVSSVCGNENDPSELHSLTDFIRHQAQD